jgi:4-amino-4-deoxy-L-arabinose transferase-like glycosyltransferase
MPEPTPSRVAANGAATCAGGGERASATPRGLALLVVGGLLALYFWGLAGVPLLHPDEGRYAEVPREMLATGDFVTPRLDGVLYFEKPPLHYWAVAAGLALLGTDELAVRLPGALLGLAGLALAYLLGRSCSGRRAGAWSAVVLGTSPLYVAMAHLSAPDMAVSFFIGATLTCFWFAHRAAGRGGELFLWWGVFVSSALAVLAKGLIGVLIPGAVVVLYLALCGGWGGLRRVPWISGTLMFLALAAPWHVLMALRHPDFLSFYFVHEHFLRYATRVTGRWQPVWFFLPVLLVGSLPWCGFLPSVVRHYRPEQGWRPRSLAPELVFFGGWGLLVVVFFSLSSSKLIPYILPALLPFAVLTGVGLAGAARRRAAFERGGVIAATILLALLVAAVTTVGLGRLPRVLATHVSPVVVATLGGVALLLVLAGGVGEAAGRPWGAVALALSAATFFAIVWVILPALPDAHCGRLMATSLASRLKPGETVVAVGDYPQTIPFYLRREIDVAGYTGELAFGISRLAADARLRRFPTLPELVARLREGEAAYLITGAQDLQRLRAQGVNVNPLGEACGGVWLVRAGDGASPSTPAKTGR